MYQEDVGYIRVSAELVAAFLSWVYYELCALSAPDCDQAIHNRYSRVDGPTKQLH